MRHAVIIYYLGDQWFNRLTLAWKSAWREGIFPNPSQVRLHLELDAITPTEECEDWRLTLANLWSDLLLRRVADFASSLFQPRLHGDSIPTEIQLSSTLLGWIFKVGGIFIIFEMGGGFQSDVFKDFLFIVESSGELCSNHSCSSPLPIARVEWIIYLSSPAIAQ